MARSFIAGMVKDFTANACLAEFVDLYTSTVYTIYCFAPVLLNP